MVNRIKGYLPDPTPTFNPLPVYDADGDYLHLTLFPGRYRELQIDRWVSIYFQGEGVSMRVVGCQIRGVKGELSERFGSVFKIVDDSSRLKLSILIQGEDFDEVTLEALPDLHSYTFGDRGPLKCRKGEVALTDRIYGFTFKGV